MVINLAEIITYTIFFYKTGHNCVSNYADDDDGDIIILWGLVCVALIISLIYIRNLMKGSFNCRFEEIGKVIIMDYIRVLVVFVVFEIEVLYVLVMLIVVILVIILFLTILEIVLMSL